MPKQFRNPLLIFIEGDAPFMRCAFDLCRFKIQDVDELDEPSETYTMTFKTFNIIHAMIPVSVQPRRQHHTRTLWSSSGS